MQLPRSAAPTFAALLLASLGLAGCGGDGGDMDAFEEEVVAARDTVDSSFAYIKRPESTTDLVRRLRTSRDRVGRAAKAVAAADAPSELEDEGRRLANGLRQMSKEMGAVANSIEIVETADPTTPVQSVVFDTWDTVQNALTELRNEGVDVSPLRPGGGP
jgi:hypothetical protein